MGRARSEQFTGSGAGLASERARQCRLRSLGSVAMQTEIGLTLALVSAVTVNIAYSLEHDAASRMPEFSIRRPRQFLASLLGDRHWLLAFGTETVGWLIYVAALRLAPLSLVQAVGAAGIAVLAVATARGHPGRLSRRERIAVLVAIVGLLLLSLSLVGTEQVDHAPDGTVVVIWLACAAGGAAALALVPTRIARGPALGLAAGLLFAGGDISAKLVTYGGVWFLAILTLIAFYGMGTSLLQAGFQRANALTAAGLATL